MTSNKSNIRTILNVLRQDNIDGYDYMEYTTNANGWNRTWIINKGCNSIFTNGSILFYYENDQYYFSGTIPMDDFMAMDNTEIIKWLAQYSYYNTFDREGIIQ